MNQSINFKHRQYQRMGGETRLSRHGLNSLSFNFQKRKKKKEKIKKTNDDWTFQNVP